MPPPGHRHNIKCLEYGQAGAVAGKREVAG